MLKTKSWMDYMQQRWFIHGYLFLGAGQNKGICKSSAMESEFHALIIAMQNCWIKRCTQVIFEGGCKSLADLFEGILRIVGYITGFERYLIGKLAIEWVKMSLNQPTEYRKPNIEIPICFPFLYFTTCFVL